MTFIALAKRLESLRLRNDRFWENCHSGGGIVPIAERRLFPETRNLDFETDETGGGAPGGAWGLDIAKMRPCPRVFWVAFDSQRFRIDWPAKMRPFPAGFGAKMRVSPTKNGSARHDCRAVVVAAVDLLFGGSLTQLRGFSKGISC